MKDELGGKIMEKFIGLKAKTFSYLIGSSLENYTSNNTRQHDTTRVQHNATRDNTRQHKYNMTQQEYNTTQHETTRVQHETTRVQRSINVFDLFISWLHIRNLEY